MSNKRLAKKGRYGDTRIRKVDGRKSHVNKREADMIDIYSNGFKSRIATDPNVAETYVFMAMADNPFKYATAR